MTFYVQIAIALFAIIATALTFYNTILTKKWRDTAPNEKDSWLLGFIYYNPADQRIMLPKRSGLGITLNFAKPAAIVIFALITSLIIAYILAVLL